MEWKRELKGKWKRERRNKKRKERGREIMMDIKEKRSERRKIWKILI